MRKPLCLAFAAALAAASPVMAASTMAKVKQILNGSTLKVDMRGQEKMIHLHGVATPDPSDKREILQKLGKEATAYLQEYLKSGWIYVEYPTGQPAPDAQGVIPAYVYRGTDAKFVNEELVASGLGIVNRKVQSIHSDALLEREKQARGATRGVWGAFTTGSGQEIAAGKKNQGSYIGELIPERKPDNVILIWIISYQ